jgi:hypothetical protein
MNLWTDLNKGQKIFTVGLILGTVLGAVLAFLEDE